MPNGILFFTLWYDIVRYGIAKCYVIPIVAVSLCLLSSHCTTCPNLCYSVSNENLLYIAFQVSPGTEVKFQITLFVMTAVTTEGFFVNTPISTVCGSSGVPYRIKNGIWNIRRHLAFSNSTASNHQVAHVTYSSLHLHSAARRIPRYII